MADITVFQLTELAANPSAGDFIPIWQVSTSQYKKITATNLFPFTVTGGGTIATGGFTFTIPKTGTGVVGAGTAGRVAEWVTDANTVQASTLAKTGAGVLTLSASGAFTFTVPKTGTGVVGTGTIGRIAEWVTDANTVQASTLVKTGAGVLTMSAGSDFAFTVPATGTAAILESTNIFTGQLRASGPLVFGRTDLTIASGAVTITGSHHRIDTESGAATDDLDTINGMTAIGQLLILGAVNSSRTVVLKDGAGNLRLNGDFSLDNVEDMITLVSGTSSTWHEMSRSDNGA